MVKLAVLNYCYLCCSCLEFIIFIVGACFLFFVCNPVCVSNPVTTSFTQFSLVPLPIFNNILISWQPSAKHKQNNPANHQAQASAHPSYLTLETVGYPVSVSSLPSHGPCPLLYPNPCSLLSFRMLYSRISALLWINCIPPITV